MTKPFNKLRKALDKATPRPWAFNSNTPFYVVMQKPSPSLSKHDDDRPEFWSMEDGTLVSLAVHQLPKVLNLLDDAIEIIDKIECSCDYDAACGKHQFLGCIEAMHYR